MSELPTGTVTFLFTDIEGSTRLLQQLGDRYADVLAEHQRLLRGAFQEKGGREVDTQGDAFFYAFDRARDAVFGATNAQKAINGHSWPDGVSLRVRMGLHTGEPIRTEVGYVGMDVHRSARICSAGHGGQILLSQATRGLIENDMPEGVSLRDLGEHRLKDLQHPEQVFQLVTSDLPTDFPALKSLDTLPNNLPLQLTSFIGREKEIAEVKQLFITTRLLTLTGSGGCGKTRLGLQVVADLLEEFPDGVWVVELAPLSDPGLVPQEVASVLEVSEMPDRSLLDALSNYLRTKQLLLMLDNCEHLIETCTKLSDTLLHSCPNLKILVASREALGIAGESTYRVPSLSLPDPVGASLVSALMQYEAVRLFIDRAIAGVSTFTVTDDNAPALAQICRRLDGIPLAIELAAARVKVLSVEQITKRLDDRFRLLTGGSRTALPRQQTLRAMIDWSYNQLSEKERVLFNRTSVFMGGWTLEAVEAICSDESIEEYEVLDTLTGLVDKSLLVAEERKGEKRYSLLETVRQYARDKLLESGEAEVLRERHLEWYLGLAEKAEPELEGPDQVEWIDRLELELDNLRVALEWSLGSKGKPEEGDPIRSRSDPHSPNGEREEAEQGLRLGMAIAHFFYKRGYLSEGREWLERLLAMTGSAVSASPLTVVRVKALDAAGSLALFQLDHAAARAFMKESLGLKREHGDKHGVASSLSNLGMVAQYEGDYSQAMVLLEESLAIGRSLGDTKIIAESLMQRGVMAHYQGDYATARRHLEESLAVSRTSNDRDVSPPLGALGYLALDQGDYTRARTAFEERLAIWQEVGYERHIALSVSSLGSLALAEGDYVTARVRFEESLTIWSETGDRGGIAFLLAVFAELAIAEAQPWRALRLAGVAAMLREKHGTPLALGLRAKLEHTLHLVKSAYSGEDEETAWAEGRAMSMEEAISFALEKGGKDA